MYYPCSENKGADQLRGYREADLRLCFRLCRLLVSHEAAHVYMRNLPFGSTVYPGFWIDLPENNLGAYCLLCCMVTPMDDEDSHSLSAAQDPDRSAQHVRSSTVTSPLSYCNNVLVLSLVLKLLFSPEKSVGIGI